MTMAPKDRPQHPHPKAIEEAKLHPNGYVYQLDGDFRDDEFVPPDRIMGMWEVDESGEIVGDFIPNPNYRRRPEKD